MNIYVIDPAPVLAARALSDQHLLAAALHAHMILTDAIVLRRYVAATLDGDPAASIKGCAHPRHPLTRAAARSPSYARWVADYGAAALLEVPWRESRPDPLPSLRDMFANFKRILEGLCPVDPVAKRRLRLGEDPGALRDIDVDPGLPGFPQRLEGSADLVTPGDPVTGYRRWYAAAKIPGGERAWAGTQASWTRRAPPAWLLADGEVVAEMLPWCGIGAKPAHEVIVARHLTPRPR